MKKLLLSFGVLLAGFTTHSQVILSVQQPTSIAAVYNSNNFDLTYAQDVNGWGVADLTFASNSVSGNVKLARDLSATADTLMCVAAAPGSLTGKIALLYVGTCNYSVKAKMAQDAGAIGVIIVSNVPGSVAPMGAGIDGANVTIPVIFVRDVIGAPMKQKLDNNENVIVYIGAIQNHFVTDLGSSSSDVVTAQSQAIPLALVQNPSVLPINFGITVYNYGSANAIQARVNVKVNYNGVLIYSANSAYFNLNSGYDLLVNSFPSFTPASYSLGEYTIVYTITTQNSDQNLSNNMVTTKFSVTTDLYSPASLNASGLPATDTYYYGSSAVSSFETCIHFQNPNSENVGAEGMHFKVSAGVGIDLTGKVLNLKAYRWDEQFTSTIDPNFSFDVNSIYEISNTSYTFPSNLNQIDIYQPFAAPIILENNQRYLFCLRSENPIGTIYIGYNTQTNRGLDVNPQPLNLIRVEGDWYSGFSNQEDLVPSFGLKTFSCSASLPAPTASNVSSCNGGSFTLTATGEANSQLFWYQYPSDAPNYYFETGASLYVPYLSQTTTIYVGQKIPGCMAFSPLKEVTLFVNPNTSSTITQSVCGTSFDFNGNTFFSSGIYSLTIPNANGCDSLITLNLTFVSAYTTNNPQAICQGGSYTINNNTYTTAGTYTNVFPSVSGCDSTVITVLTVNPKFAVNNLQTICHGSSYTLNGNIYIAAGTYTDVLQSVNGCDSTITTILTVKPVYNITNPQSICQGDSYTIGVNTYTTAGTYLDVFPSVTGCDSTIKTVLTIITTQLNLAVTNVDATLTVGEAGASYQWLNCDNGKSVITGATSRSFTAELGGNYAVIVTKCGITDTSDCAYISGLNVNEKALNLNVNLYPNPAATMVTISVQDANLESLMITDLNGKQLFQQTAFGQSSDIQVGDLSSGVYLVNIKTEKGTVVKRFVKE